MTLMRINAERTVRACRGRGVRGHVPATPPQRLGEASFLVAAAQPCSFCRALPALPGQARLAGSRTTAAHLAAGSTSRTGSSISAGRRGNCRPGSTGCIRSGVAVDIAGTAVKPGQADARGIGPGSPGKVAGSTRGLLVPAGTGVLRIRRAFSVVARGCRMLGAAEFLRGFPRSCPSLDPDAGAGGGKPVSALARRYMPLVFKRMARGTMPGRPRPQTSGGFLRRLCGAEVPRASRLYRPGTSRTFTRMCVASRSVNDPAARRAA